MTIDERIATLPVPGTELGRFRVVVVEPLEEYQAAGVLLEEKISGCQIYHVVCDDSENLFSFNFKTIPSDSTGVAHILEHTVLCGSENFPVKDPFAMLYQGSMQTFLNAMTFPDKTVYPAASTVRQDLFNLMAVYADAVFFPLLREDHFRQEGHRLDRDDDGNPEITGIVYNEMKAHYSTHDAIAGEWSYRSLFPDNGYAHDSGGDPLEIPSLTYEQFTEFHRRHYHPSNCRVFLYGDIPTADYLEFLEERIFSRFSEAQLAERTSIDIPLQEAWTAKQDFAVAYPVDADGGDDSTSVTLNWLLPSIEEPEKALAFELISEILLGNPASPIQKIINESELGEDLSPSTGFESDLRQMVFSIGMRGTAPEKAGEVEALIIDGLKSVVKDGIDPELLEATIRRFEFRSREIKGGGPFGLRLLIRSLRGWLHGLKPSQTILFEPLLADLKKQIVENPGLLTGYISEYLLDNPHMSRVTVSPDPGMIEADQEREADMCREKFAALGKDVELRNAELDTRVAAFAEFQAEEEREEDLASVPFLSTEDIPRTVKNIPGRESRIGGDIPMYDHEVFTNGITYIDIGFDITDLAPAELAYLSLLTHVLPQIGSSLGDYEWMAKQWGLRTGGFSAYAENSLDVEGKQRIFAYLRLKALDSMLEPGLELVSDLLVNPDLSDPRFLWELFQEYRNEFRSSIIPSGSSFASSRAAAGIIPGAGSDDLLRGVGQGQFLELIYADSKSRGREAASADLARVLAEISRKVFSGDKLIFNVTAQNPGDTVSHLESFAARLKAAGTDAASLPEVFQRVRAFAGEAMKYSKLEGISHSSKVNFTAACVPAAGLLEKIQVHEQLLAHIASSGYLYEKIRMEGGAYGAYAHSDPLSAAFLFASYRDPAITKSWQTFEEAMKVLSGDLLDQRTLDLAKIALAGRELKPLSPAQKGLVSFKRKMYGIDDDIRQKRREWMLETTVDDVRAAAARIAANYTEASRTVLGDSAVLNELAQELAGFSLVELP